MKTLYAKLLEVQQEIGSIKKDSVNPFFKSKYFDINSLLEQIKPVLNSKGILLLQGLTHEGESLCLTTELVEAETGDKVTYTAVLPNLGDPQKIGSSITYFRRYALQALLALEAEDDDANVASQGLNTKQFAQIRNDFEKGTQYTIEQWEKMSYEQKKILHQMKLSKKANQ